MFISNHRRQEKESYHDNLKRMIVPRKGGSGGKGGGDSEGGSSDSGSSSKSGSSSSDSSSDSSSRSISIGSSTKSSTTYGMGGGKVVTIPSGSLFAGRSEGGGTRTSVFGTSTYGSGYPGITNNRGVSGLGFPYYYWPLAWGSVGHSAYLHSNEYGTPDNTSRPGGPEMIASFFSSSQNTTLFVVSDNSTVVSLISTVQANCSSLLASNSSTTPSAYNSSDPDTQPESVIQYYRASSVSLLLDGYNNTADDSTDNTTANAPLPTNIDTNLLGCLNYTIGESVPLVDGAHAMWSAPGISSLLGLVCLLRCLLSWF